MKTVPLTGTEEAPDSISNLPGTEITGATGMQRNLRITEMNLKTIMRTWTTKVATTIIQEPAVNGGTMKMMMIFTRETEEA